MAASGATITMTLREADRLKTIQALVDRAYFGERDRSFRSIVTARHGLS